jgi:hypothetical protein
LDYDRAPNNARLIDLLEACRESDSLVLERTIHGGIMKQSSLFKLASNGTHFGEHCVLVAISPVLGVCCYIHGSPQTNQRMSHAFASCTLALCWE